MATVAESAAWAAGDSGTILKTSDGGATWTRQQTGISGNLASVSFTDALTGWTSGANGTVLKTTDGGLHWSRQNSGTTDAISKIQAINENICFALGWGSMYRTLDGGSIWSPIFMGWFGIPESFHFINADTGWAVGWGGAILKTNAPEEGWYPLESGTTDNLLDVWFTNQTHGWVAGWETPMLATEDGGTTWLPQPISREEYLNAIMFTDENHGWVVGDGGAILHTSDGGWPVGVVESGSAMKRGRLTIFPNPASTAVTVSYMLENPGSMSFMVYDSRGIQVRKMEFTNQSSGVHKFILQTSDFQPGLFTCRLQSENAAETRKLVVVRN